MGRKVVAWTAAVLLAGLVGLSRLYLGASWLTDVLGGLALGAAWLFALLTIVRTIDNLRAHPTEQPPPAATQHDHPAAPTRSTQARGSPATGSPHD